MSDDLDDLRAALKAAPPRPDPAAREAALRLAMENFDRHQETRVALRPSQDRPERAGFLTGVRMMFARLTTRPALAATASVAALCAGVYLVLPHQPGAPGLPTAVTAPAPAIVPAPPSPPTLASPAPAPEADDARTQAAAPTDATAIAEAAPAGLHDKTEAASPVIVPSEPRAVAQSRNEAPGMSALGKSAAPAAPVSSFAPPQGLPLQQQPEMASAQPDAVVAPALPDTEAFAGAETNPVRITSETPVSTFSVDVDTASYAVIRSSLSAGALPPPEAVRIEEMVNYFPYAYPAPEAAAAPFATRTALFETPWNPDTQILRIGLQGHLPALETRPALNLVFLIDTSGSMQDANKLPLLRQSLRLMLGKLRAEDQVAIVAYAGSAGEVLAPTPASDTAAIFAALDRLEAGGSTAGQAGLEQAYALAASMANEGEVTRVLLATDGDFNVGLSDPEALTRFIADKRDSGTYLSVLGFGRGNLDDATMQALAQNGNGTASYIDTLAEAQKVLVDQLTGALFPIANDVKVQVEFNPATVAEYRLIGYETRALRREDFNNDRVDAGEIGAGHQVTALYEITPVGSPARLSDPLRYEPAAEAAGGVAGPELGYLKLRYKAPGGTDSTLTETAISTAETAPDDDARFAAAVAGFGQLLTGASYIGDWGWDQAIALATGSRGADEFGYRAEAVQLMRLARSMSQ